ncbi:MAG: PspA-associated protein PspAA [Streptosporangiaceae bacterium]
MIVRILGEGQLEVAESALSELNDLDARLETAVESGDEAGFSAALASLLGRVREIGIPAQPGVLAPSSLILPHADATMAEVRELLADDGLIPG